MYYIGIDIGGTNLKAGLVDESYQIVAAKKTPLRFVSMEQMGETLVQMALDLLEENGVPREKVSSVGMGFPGPVDNKKGVVIKTVNIPIRFMPVAEMFHKHWDIPVYLGNDADCAALGEYYHFEDKNVESLILVTLGTGIGTGIILNGKILSGVNGCGGEGGHTVIVHDGEACSCGRKGCWERYASANALIRQTAWTAAPPLRPCAPATPPPGPWWTSTCAIWPTAWPTTSTSSRRRSSAWAAASAIRVTRTCSSPSRAWSGRWSLAGRRMSTPSSPRPSWATTPGSSAPPCWG